MKDCKVLWKIVNSVGDFREGEFTDIIDDATFKQIEGRVFSEIKELDFDATNLIWRFMRSDGSGCVCSYEKSGEVWVRKYSDNIMPNWFPIFFFGLIGLMLLSFWLMHVFGVLP